MRRDDRTAGAPARRAGNAAMGLAIGIAAAALLLAAGTWLSAPTGYDRAVLIGIRRCDPEGRLLAVATDVTALGSGPVLTLVVGVVAGWLLVFRRFRSAILLVVASESGGQMVNLAKAAIGRPRPEIVPHWIAVGDFSYPSAHSADSACVASLLALLATHAIPHPAARRYVAIVAVAFVAMIGFSRMYLGVHWPSDVLAGWSFGAAWAMAWWRGLGPSGARE